MSQGVLCYTQVEVMSTEHDIMFIKTVEKHIEKLAYLDEEKNETVFRKTGRITGWMLIHNK